MPANRGRAKNWARRAIGAGLLAAAAASGCTNLREPKLHYIGDASLHYYKDEATDISYPTGAEGTKSAPPSTPPRTVTDHHKDKIWDLTLTEAIHCALQNSEIVRSRIQSRGQISSTGLATNALRNPQNVNTVYDPAIQKSNVLFGNRGVVAALSQFDTRFTTSLVWGRNEAYQNNAFLSGFGGAFDAGGGGLVPASVLVNETATFQSGLTKRLATGGQVNVFHNWNYNNNNRPPNIQLFPSLYNGSTGISFTQPLWAGAGTAFTRIAGASNPNFQGVTGVSQGVSIARINNDITIAQFEIAVRKLLMDVESVYWELYLAYRSYDVAVIARNSALRSWREAKVKLEVGGVQGFQPADEAQAMDRYFQTVAQVKTAQNTIYIKEAALRRLMGLPPNDGRVIRPVTEPLTTKLVPNWRSCLTDAMIYRTELRAQKWRIKSLQLELQAAHSLTNPRLNFVSGYQINGFGNDLFASSDNDGTTVQGLQSAYGTLLNGNQTGWNLGLQLSMPIGFRRAKAQVRNLELRLAKAREVLAAQELDITHGVADAVQAVAYNYQNAIANFNRRKAAARRVRLFQQELEAGTTTLNLVLQAQASRATAERAYYTSLTNYNKSLAYLHLVQGTLLERDNVALDEGVWKPEAYEQALHKAWHRSYAFPNPLLKTEPPPFAVPADTGPMPQSFSSSSINNLPLPPRGDLGVPPAPAAAEEVPEPIPAPGPNKAAAPEDLEAVPAEAPSEKPFLEKPLPENALPEQTISDKAIPENATPVVPIPANPEAPSASANSVKHAVRDAEFLQPTTEPASPNSSRKATKSQAPSHPS